MLSTAVVDLRDDTSVQLLRLKSIGLEQVVTFAGSCESRLHILLNNCEHFEIFNQFQFCLRTPATQTKMLYWLLSSQVTFDVLVTNRGQQTIEREEKAILEQTRNSQRNCSTH